MTDITELKIENNAQLIELLSENVVAPYMLPTEKCNAFMIMEFGYCSTQPIGIEGEAEAHASGKAIIGEATMISILPDHVNIDVTCNGYTRFFSTSFDWMLIWVVERQKENQVNQVFLDKLPRTRPTSEPIIIDAEAIMSKS